MDRRRVRAVVLKPRPLSRPVRGAVESESTEPSARMADRRASARRLAPCARPGRALHGVAFGPPRGTASAPVMDKPQLGSRRPSDRTPPLRSGSAADAAKHSAGGAAQERTRRRREACRPPSCRPESLRQAIAPGAALLIWDVNRLGRPSHGLDLDRLALHGPSSRSARTAAARATDQTHVGSRFLTGPRGHPA